MVARGISFDMCSPLRCAADVCGAGWFQNVCTRGPFICPSLSPFLKAKGQKPAMRTSRSKEIPIFFSCRHEYTVGPVPRQTANLDANVLWSDWPRLEAQRIEAGAGLLKMGTAKQAHMDEKRPEPIGGWRSC